MNEQTGQSRETGRYNVKALKRYISKRTAFISSLLLIGGGFCLAGSATEPISLGEWSNTTNGLRGRLLFGRDPSINGTAMGVVYLELENDSAGDTLYVYYDASKKPFRCELQDAVGKAVKSEGSEYDGFIPSACWLVLPPDSTLRFRVTLGGFGVPKDAGLFIAGCVPDCWVIRPNVTGDHFLSGTLNVIVPNSESRPRMWQGTLKLPPVKIPAKAISGK